MLIAATCSAAPEFRNAKMTQETASAGLSAKFEAILQSGESTWVGYEVATRGRNRGSWNGCGEVHYLEPRERESEEARTEVGRAAVLLRIGAKALEKVDVSSEQCPIDAGGMRVHWITDARADDSVGFLSGLLSRTNLERKFADTLLMAVAIHQTPLATPVLRDFARSGPDLHLREQAAFWLGVERGSEGFLALKDLEHDSSPEFRKKLTFDISQNSDPRAVDELLRLAKTDDSVEVRGQAVFWLAQKAGKKQAANIGDLAANDPNTAVRKKAVFALTQLPAEEGVPQLVKVAETNRDPAVRKDAIFWLGQSHDPRALEYIEKVLRR